MEILINLIAFSIFVVTKFEVESVIAFVYWALNCAIVLLNANGKIGVSSARGCYYSTINYLLTFQLFFN